MAATYSGPSMAFDQSFHKLDDGRYSKIFTGPTKADVLTQMDKARAQVEARGGQELSRTSIGRNTPCPCGSGRKFKKCCLDKMC